MRQDFDRSIWRHVSSLDNLSNDEIRDRIRQSYPGIQVTHIELVQFKALKAKGSVDLKWSIEISGKDQNDGANFITGNEKNVQAELLFIFPPNFIDPTDETIITDLIGLRKRWIELSGVEYSGAPDEIGKLMHQMSRNINKKVCDEIGNLYALDQNLFHYFVEQTNRNLNSLEIYMFQCRRVYGDIENSNIAIENLSGEISLIKRNSLYV
jgi:hypothetical protein